MSALPIPDFPHYFVTEEGVVYRETYIDKAGITRKKKTTIPVFNGRLNLHKNGRTHNKSLANIMLRVFIGDPPPGKESARHLDDDRSNNHLSNLAWGSQKDNAEDSRRNGTLNNHTGGTIWITDGERSRRISGEIPKGWVRGRANDFKERMKIATADAWADGKFDNKRRFI